MWKMSSVEVKIVYNKISIYMWKYKNKKRNEVYFFKINTYLIEHEYINRISCSI